jgi:hypothetical protein
MSKVVQEGCHCRPYLKIGAYEKPTEMTEPKNLSFVDQHIELDTYHGNDRLQIDM